MGQTISMPPSYFKVSQMNGDTAKDDPFAFSLMSAPARIADLIAYDRQNEFFVC